MAISPEIAANCLKLELRWIKLAERADRKVSRPTASAKPSIAARAWSWVPAPTRTAR